MRTDCCDRRRNGIHGGSNVCRSISGHPYAGTSTIGTGSTKIVWWHISTQQNQRENWANLANAFIKQHPDVSIEITVLENEAFKAKLSTAMQSGNPPDIFQSWGGGVLQQFATTGLVQDLTPASRGDRMTR